MFVWFHSINVMCLHPADSQDRPDIVNALCRLIGEVQEDIKNNKDVWNRVFVR